MELELIRLEPVLITIHGKEYPARMPNRAVKELSEMWGIKYFDLFEKLANGAFELDEIMDVLYVTLKSGGVTNISRDMFEDMDHDINFIAEVTTKITELFDRSQRVENMLEDSNGQGINDKKKKKTPQ